MLSKDYGANMTANSPKNAVILAAGFGSRLRPLTDLRPKPLVEVIGTSIIHDALRNLEAVGVEKVTVVVGYRKDAIQYACGIRFGELAFASSVTELSICHPLVLPQLLVDTVLVSHHIFSGIRICLRRVGSPRDTGKRLTSISSR
ncbi:hypothetical protein AOQ71_06705 [Bradyrhizobium manausense]|uniref:Nucleotidyl transferase domain-containing protein n=1 Tax=Bradyrhizobium manausense TaxID=989370 RepID=A0A0R3E224_9BRAD|nr:hypothetical protein AOQ71_06705 [Bradyrhizobium manausense]